MMARKSRSGADGCWDHDGSIALVQNGDLIIIDTENARCAVTDADLKL